MPEISVIMPCYNTDEKMFRECIKSILSQTFTDFELIIVDDGSREESRRVYEETAGTDSRIRLFTKENGGVSRARNFGTEQAEGRYIIFSDSDDILFPDFFKEAYETAVSRDADIVYGCNIHLDDLEKYEQRPFTEESVTVLEGDGIKTMKPCMVGKRLRYENGMIYIGRGPWTRIIKRELALSVKFDTSLAICEDIVWNLELLERAKKICCVKRAWYAYRMYAGSSSKKGSDKIIVQAEEGLTSVKKHLDLTVDADIKAFGDRCLEDLYRINKNYITKLDPAEAREKKKRLYTAEPWTFIKSSGYFRTADIKNKVKTVLYRFRLYLK